MQLTKETLLARYGLTEQNFIGRGMEAEVYRAGAGEVVKLYPYSDHVATNLHTLQVFYATLPRTLVPYALPAINQITAEGEWLVTREPYLAGEPLTKRLATCPPSELETLFPTYVAAVHALGQIPMPPTATGYKLFDPARLGLRAAGDWHVFLRCWLQAQLVAVASYFAQDVVNFTEKLSIMERVLAQPYRGDYQLIHGDIFPGNLLVGERGQVTALLDFGLFTLYGDPLFDAATAWVFFDMYDELRADVRSRLLPFVLGQYGAANYGKIVRYLLLYSLLSANTYAPDCSDGHYQWCVRNLNTAAYWEQIE